VTMTTLLIKIEHGDDIDRCMCEKNTCMETTCRIDVGGGSTMLRPRMITRELAAVRRASAQSFLDIRGRHAKVLNLSLACAPQAVCSTSLGIYRWVLRSSFCSNFKIWAPLYSFACGCRHFLFPSPLFTGKQNSRRSILIKIVTQIL
jgi:hypothetical protein